MLRALTPACALVLLVGCASQVAPPAPARADAPVSAAARQEAITGGLSEAEFKALHRPPTNVPPPPQGVRAEVGGAACYLALPRGARAPLPGVVVMHEWWGLNDNIRHWADRLAAEGYAALAVDLYDGTVATTADEAMDAVQKVDGERALEILRAAQRFLREDPRVRAPRTACIGWCFGGTKTLEFALAEPELDAAVMYYGHPITDAARLGALHAHLLGIFGARDRSIPPERVEAFRQALTAAGATFTLREYDAEHAFANPSSARYDEGHAAAAWDEARAFLARELRR
jgi:carboxymethylenebutenolidase